MAVAGFCSETFVSNSMQASFKSGIYCNQPLLNLKIRGRLLDFSMFSLSTNISKWAFKLPYKYHMFKCRASPNTDPHLDTSFVRNSAINYTWSFKSWLGSPFMVEMSKSVVVSLTIWGFLNAVHLIRKIFTNMDLSIQGGGNTILLLLLLGLQCRMIFTDFFASVMFYATRPFDVDELIQIMIGGDEIIGNVEKIGLWSTKLRSIRGGYVIIPNLKFADIVIRNLSQQNHREINIRATTSLDPSKVNNILADMRQVLKKNPRVEQQKFHPRVLAEYNDSPDQGCSILVSCFIIPSDLKDYLYVRSGITLELFKVMCDVKRSGS